MEWIFTREKRRVDDIEHLFLYVIFGTIIGARLGHCIFYDPVYYLSTPLKVFAIWEGGLASHGGAMGVLIGVYLFSIKYGYRYLWIVDRIVIPASLAGAFIRLGNFFNSEIIGTPSTLPWAIVFENFDHIPRHPTQLYESLSYLIIFSILFGIYRLKGVSLRDGYLLGIYFVSIFSVRFMLEFIKFKQEAYSSDLALSMGQFLSLPFILFGVYLLYRAYYKHN
jgi:prolipoprotein diacylglyceryl transferase